MTLLRYGRSEYRRQQRMLIAAVVGSICVVTFIVFFGLPLLVNFSLIVDKLRGTSPAAKSKAVILAPSLDPLLEATNSAALTISGRGTAGETLLLYINDAETKKLTIPDSGDFRTTILGKQGKNTISAKILGNGDTLSELSNVVTTTVINEEPELDVTAPADNAEYVGDQTSITIEGKTGEENTVTVNDRRVVLREDGSFHYTVRLSEGENTFTIVATDVAGNKTTVERKVTYQQ